MPEVDLQTRLETSGKSYHDAREASASRKDDKILIDWNALIIDCVCQRRSGTG